MNRPLRNLVRRVARQGKTLTYGELCRQMDSPGYHPRSARLHREMEEICRWESGRGRGMPCVVVVRQDSGRPGAGFFRTARSLGKRGTDEEIFRREFLKATGAKPPVRGR